MSIGDWMRGREHFKKVEGEMEQALTAVQIVFYLMGGLGLFFLGIGVLWFVDIYKKKSA
nr:putative integron gene cassette protein [uncultured bacterium]